MKNLKLFYKWDKQELLDFLTYSGWIKMETWPFVVGTKQNYRYRSLLPYDVRKTDSTLIKMWMHTEAQYLH